MEIKYWDYLRDYSENSKDFINQINKTLSSGSIILGKQVKLLEKKISSFVGCRYGIGVNSGTDALIISLMAIGIKKGDEVITTSNTAIPTVSAIVTVGAKPIFVDINERNYLINENLIEKSITKKTKAIIVVNLYGQSPNFGKIKQVSKKYNLKIIEDCAQSLGAKYGSKNLGSIGDVSAFSFYPTKILGTFGDGGLITTNNKKIYERSKILRYYGIKKNYVSEIHGINSRLDEIHAAILNLKFKKINQYIKKRRFVAHFYKDNITNKLIGLPYEEKNNFHVFYNFVIRTKKRNSLKNYLNKNNVQTKIVYPFPIHKMNPYKRYVKKRYNLHNTNILYKEILSLPIYPELKLQEMKKIVSLINSFK